MTKRKVQLTGGGTTSIISLPKKWVKKHQIKQGDEVTLLETKSGPLLLLPPLYKDCMKSAVTVEELIQPPIKNGAPIEHYITSNYLKGTKEIKITSKSRISQEDLDFIRLIVDKLMGYEIVRQEERKILIKDHLSVESIDVKELVNRLYQLIIQLYDAILKVPGTDDGTAAVLSRHAEAEKLAYLLRRMLLSSSYDPKTRHQTKLDTMDIPLLNEMVTNLRDLGKSVLSLAEEMKSHTFGNAAEIYELNKEIKNFLEKTGRSFESKDKTKAILLLD